MKIIETIRAKKAVLVGSAVGVGLALVAAPAMATPTPGPGVAIVEDAVEQLQFDATQTLPTVMIAAVVLFGAGLLWRIVRKYVRP